MEDQKGLEFVKPKPEVLPPPVVPQKEAPKGTIDSKALSSRLEQKGATPKPSGFDHNLRSWLKTSGMKRIQGSAGEEGNRIVVAAINAIEANPALLKCDFNSFTTALLTSADLKLYPGPMEECAYVPYSGVIKFQPMYKGLVKLAFQSGFVKQISAEVVWENDLFEFRKGDDPRLLHAPNIDADITERGERRGVYAVIQLVNGGVQREYMNAKAVMRIKKKAPAGGKADSPWNSDNPDIVDAMWRKTVLKKALKLIPRSAQLARALRADDESENSKENTNVIDLSKLAADIEKSNLDGSPEEPEKPNAEENGKN